ncbi:hypothetical protein BJF90_01595 [Pseudonocardia sp. CNS-004]|nr:hypothetical protein BJF90_01595 [Pseudonocardia sp. CNS-004]
MTALDGNAIAGMLQTAFGQDMTAAPGTCAGCGAASRLGQARVYRGAGTVLRCPNCEGVLMVIIENGGVMGIDAQGLTDLHVPW